MSSSQHAEDNFRHGHVRRAHRDWRLPEVINVLKELDDKAMTLINATSAERVLKAIPRRESSNGATTAYVKCVEVHNMEWTDDFDLLQSSRSGAMIDLIHSS
jgi:hypothetical protein